MVDIVAVKTKYVAAGVALQYVSCEVVVVVEERRGAGGVRTVCNMSLLFSLSISMRHQLQQDTPVLSIYVDRYIQKLHEQFFADDFLAKEAFDWLDSVRGNMSKVSENMRLYTFVAQHMIAVPIIN